LYTYKSPFGNPSPRHFYFAHFSTIKSPKYFILHNHFVYQTTAGMRIVELGTGMGWLGLLLVEGSVQWWNASHALHALPALLALHALRALHALHALQALHAQGCG
jgi:hypothetical protein